MEIVNWRYSSRAPHGRQDALECSIFFTVDGRKVNVLGETTVHRVGLVGRKLGNFPVRNGTSWVRVVILIVFLHTRAFGNMTSLSMVRPYDHRSSVSLRFKAMRSQVMVVMERQIDLRQGRNKAKDLRVD